jgi:DNA adenine methylase
MTGKLNYWFSDEVVGLLARTEKRAESFEEFLPRANLRDDDFIFFDPPYDTEFSDYDQFSFARREQEGLADIFAHLPCPALMIIGKTPLIEQLYLQAQQANPEIVIEEYEKVYAYNVRGRNERGMTHLAIRNYPLPAA